MTIKAFLSILAIPTFIAICGLALVANADAALSGKYADADQFLYSIMSR
jgi:hypothetical protein